MFQLSDIFLCVICIMLFYLYWREKKKNYAFRSEHKQDLMLKELHHLQEIVVIHLKKHGRLPVTIEDLCNDRGMCHEFDNPFTGMPDRVIDITGRNAKETREHIRPHSIIFQYALSPDSNEGKCYITITDKNKRDLHKALIPKKGSGYLTVITKVPSPPTDKRSHGSV